MQTSDFCCAGLVRVEEHLTTVENIAHENKQEHLEHRRYHERMEEKMDEVMDAIAKRDNKVLWWLVGIMATANLALALFIIEQWTQNA